MTDRLGPYALGQVHHADCREALALLPAESVRCVCTSPPYWGLRKYDVPEMMWGGRPECTHDFGAEVLRGGSKSGQGHNGQMADRSASQGERERSSDSLGSFCRICGAWRGQLGLEPTPAAYVEHLVGIFCEVRRVLREDGTLWLNIGDGYAASATSNHGRGKATPATNGRGEPQRGRGWENPPRSAPADGLKPKDLIGVPWLLAFALRADGWYLRAEIVWCLSGGAWVYARTQKGDMPVMVKDLVRLDPATVQLWNGEKWTRVLGWNESAGTSERVEIVLRSGERIGCTGGHRWPTKRGDVLARDLVVGDVLSSCRLPEPGDCAAPDYMTENVCWLAGLYLAEGSRGRADNTRLSLHADEEWWVSGITKAVAALGGTTTHHVRGKNLTVRIFGRVACAAIESIVGGRTSHDKHVRPEVWRLPNRCLRAIAKGYLDGDGHDDQGNERVRIGFCRSYSLERDLRTLAARLGATLTLNPCVVTYQGGKKPAFRGEWRWTRSGHHNEKDRGEVVEIRRSRARRFWNIEVEDEPHLFALASGVLTHNSKTAPMPESVRDRPTRAHEQVFLLSKSERYFYNEAEAKEPAGDNTHGRGGGINPKATDTKQDHMGRRHAGFNERWRVKQNASFSAAVSGVVSERNWRTVWTIGPEPNNAQHYAPFPRELARRCIVAGGRVGDEVLLPARGPRCALQTASDARRSGSTSGRSTSQRRTREAAKCGPRRRS